MLRRHMYQVANLRELLRLRGRRLRVGRNVVLLGLVSLFTDISSEMVAAILPLYLVYTLGFSPLQFGVRGRAEAGRGGDRPRPRRLPCRPDAQAQGGRRPADPPRALADARDVSRHTATTPL